MLMTWKLFVSVLAIADTGGPATTALATDYPSKVECERVAALLADVPPETTVGGRRVYMKVKTLCSPTGPPPNVVYGPPRGSRPPPPIAGIINGFMGGF